MFCESARRGVEDGMEAGKRLIWKPRICAWCLTRPLLGVRNGMVGISGLQRDSGVTATICKCVHGFHCAAPSLCITFSL